MSLYDDVTLTDLDRKARQVFGEHVVVKSLAQQTVFHGLPRYVTEYLIAKYVKPETWKTDLANIQNKIKDLLPDIERRELVKDRLLRMGETVLIDFVEVRVDLKNGQHWARMQAINDDKVRVSPALIEQQPGLLLGGLWGTTKLRYAPEIAADAPIELTAFTPFQVGPPDLSAYRTGRAQFSSDEWICLMLQSAGYAPQSFPERRQRLLLLTRLVPLVERNVTLVELGPRQTGKTFLLRNVSPRTFTISGGRTTPANLFVNLSTRAIGILGTRKVVVFDEIAHTTFGDEDATISTLKDYMESGQFSRGAMSFAADASLVFTGNLDVDGSLPDPRYRHLFEPLPEQLIDSAFLDRLQGYLPGWEVPKITPAALASGVGFVTDYFGEVLAKLREDDFQDRVAALEFAVGVTRRDQVAIQRIASGLIKLLYPDGKLSEPELHECVSLACELRQRVHNQLAEIAPGEFKPRLIGCNGLTEHAALDLRVSREVLPQDDRLNHEAVVGAVTGLSVIMQDGAVRDSCLSLVQVSAFSMDRHSRGSLDVTGSHGRVMSESVRTAYTIVRNCFREFGISEKRLHDQQVAVHLVRIAEPKEGPSAGLAFVVGIVSALTGRPVKAASAMTGEVTLHGEVIGVGGVPWKLRAAAKAGRKLVLIPAENAKEVAQVPDEILAKLEVVPVRTIQEALEKVLSEPLAEYSAE
jgi:ATP-dependent Lon protease